MIQREQVATNVVVNELELEERNLQNNDIQDLTEDEKALIQILKNRIKIADIYHEKYKIDDLASRLLILENICDDKNTSVNMELLIDQFKECNEQNKNTVKYLKKVDKYYPLIILFGFLSSLLLHSSQMIFTLSAFCIIWLLLNMISIQLHGKSVISRRIDEEIENEISILHLNPSLKKLLRSKNLKKKKINYY